MTSGVVGTQQGLKNDLKASNSVSSKKMPGGFTALNDFVHKYILFLSAESAVRCLYLIVACRETLHKVGLLEHTQVALFSGVNSICPGANCSS